MYKFFLPVYILRGKSIIIQQRYRKQLFRYVIFLLLEAPCTILISNFRRVRNIVCFLLGNSPASKFYTPKSRKTTSVPSSYTCVHAYEDGTGRVFRNFGI